MQRLLTLLTVLGCCLEVSNGFYMIPPQFRTQGAGLSEYDVGRSIDKTHSSTFTTNSRLTMIANGANSIQVALEDFPQIVNSIEIFQRLYRQKKIPSSFVVPEFEEWPNELHGFR